MKFIYTCLCIMLMLSYSCNGNDGVSQPLRLHILNEKIIVSKNEELSDLERYQLGDMEFKLSVTIENKSNTTLTIRNFKALNELNDSLANICKENVIPLSYIVLLGVDGKAHLSDLEPISHRHDFQYDWYTSQNQDITIKAGESVETDIAVRFFTYNLNPGEYHLYLYYCTGKSELNQKATNSVFFSGSLTSNKIRLFVK